MCRIMEEFAKEQREATLIQAIKNLMETLNLTAEAAMNALKISEEDQKKLTKKL